MEMPAHPEHLMPSAPLNDHVPGFAVVGWMTRSITCFLSMVILTMFTTKPRGPLSNRCKIKYGRRAFGMPLRAGARGPGFGQVKLALMNENSRSFILGANGVWNGRTRYRER